MRLEYCLSSSISLVYLFLFIRVYRTKDGWGRVYLLNVYGSIALYCLTRSLILLFFGVREVVTTYMNLANLILLAPAISAWVRDVDGYYGSTSND